MTKKQLALVGGTSLAGGVILYRLFKSMIFSKNSLQGKTVLITGGSRGLGLAIAEQYAQHGAKLLLCARNSDELEQAKKKLTNLKSNFKSEKSNIKPEIATYPCDLTNSAQMKQLIDTIASDYGKIDILINNAGIMEVGPLETLGIERFRKVADTNLFGMIELTLAALPHMPRGSRIVNITSIGASVSIPHLLPYSVSKFGALGFSLGLDAELGKRGISVTTVLPGLMRTGSFVNATFFGNPQKELNWFKFGANFPLLSMSSDSAAHKIFRAAQERNHFVVLGPQAKFLRLIYQIFPTAMLAAMRMASRLLPQPTSAPERTGIPGKQLRAI